MFSRRSLTRMARALRYVSAGLAAIGAAGRPGYTVSIPIFGWSAFGAESGVGPATRDRRRTDADALAGDWRAVGGDLRSAMEKMDDQQRGEAQPAIESGLV